MHQSGDDTADNEGSREATGTSRVLGPKGPS
jgi:hypothetical protein